MTDLRIGNEVELINCSRCSSGTVTGFSRNRIEVVFADQPGTRWLLRAESLRLVEQVTSAG